MKINWIGTLNNVIYNCPTNTINVKIKDIEALAIELQELEDTNDVLRSTVSALKTSLEAQVRKSSSRALNAYKEYL